MDLMDDDLKVVNKHLEREWVACNVLPVGVKTVCEKQMNVLGNRLADHLNRECFGDPGKLTGVICAVKNYPKYDALNIQTFDGVDSVNHTVKYEKYAANMPKAAIQNPTDYYGMGYSNHLEIRCRSEAPSELIPILEKLDMYLLDELSTSCQICGHEIRKTKALYIYCEHCHQIIRRKVIRRGCYRQKDIVGELEWKNTTLVHK